MPDTPSVDTLDELRTRLRERRVTADAAVDDLAPDRDRRATVDEIRKIHEAKGKVAGLRIALDIVDDLSNDDEEGSG